MHADPGAPIRPALQRIETLWEDGEVRLSRCWPESGGATVLLVTPVQEQPPSAVVTRLEQEYALRAGLAPEWAARPQELRLEGGRMALVLADPGGELLARSTGQAFEIGRFLRLGVALATALGEVHRSGIIHKDIKPAHMLVDAQDQVRLTGFGLASRLPREHQLVAPPEVIAGTLAYMAPEQTGRMNRSVDSRSDLYALGVTFYEMLVGQLPFAATDPLGWIHCHMARQPVPPSQRAAVPGPVSEIVMKLLAKTAEERYQTAEGVAADLRRCLTQWESAGYIAPFALGVQDASDRLLIPEKLYGRERETKMLLAAFDRVVASGTPELVLVSGFSGIGKSAVVNELHKALVPPRGLFAAGKFDQYKRDIPYATLAQAFQSLVRPLLGRSEAELGCWRDALHEALGANAQLITSLTPELELVIGKPPPVPKLPPQEARHRFQLVFQRFLSVFARAEHPLALFLDDLQWLDSATLDLLEHLLTQSVPHLLLVGAYRDNEVGPEHRLLRRLEAIRNAGARVQEIRLAPLRLEDGTRLIADALHCKPGRARPLAQLVQAKTGGNPFFALQFFTALAEEGLLALDPVTRIWAWDMRRIRAKNYTDNVVDLMAGKLQRLSAVTLEAVKLLACLGNVAEVVTLALVQGEGEAAMHAALWPAVQAGFIFHQDSAYKFLHDRIQQAAYGLIPEVQRAAVHLRIGRALLALLPAEAFAEQIFEVVNQLNRGAARLADGQEKQQAAALNLRAGCRAKAAAAYASAGVYLDAGMALLGAASWDSAYELMFSLRLERAECALLGGQFDIAERLTGDLLAHAAGKIDQASAYHIQVLLHTVKSENTQAVAAALTCLRLFGIDIPADPDWEQVEAEYAVVRQTLVRHPIEELLGLPLMADAELQAAMQLLSSLLSPAYFTNPNLFCWLVCRMVNFSCEHGICGASVHGCAYLGGILGPVFHRYFEGYRFGRLACDLVEKHGFVAYQAKAHHSMGLVALWTQPIGMAIDFHRSAIRAASETGDLTSACYAMEDCLMLLMQRNDPLDAVGRELEERLSFVRKTGFRDMADTLLCQQRFVAAMQGRTARLSSFDDAQFDEAAFEAGLTPDRMSLMICFYWIIKLKARLLSGDYAEALEAAERAKPLLWCAGPHAQSLDYYYYGALTVAAAYDNAAAGQQQAWRALLAAHLERLHEWAQVYPPTFSDKHLLVSAELARIEGRELDAMRLYEAAGWAARTHGFVLNEALAHETAARFYAARGFATSAQAHLRNARYCYLRWGAEAKVAQLDQLYPELRTQAPLSAPTATIGTPLAQLDAGVVVKASQALSGAIVLSKLIEMLMSFAVEHAGAERGLLILFRGDEPGIAAEATTRNGKVEVKLRQAVASAAELPMAVLHYVLRTQESVILDDAMAPTLFSEDAYVRQLHPRSVLCLPLIKQGKLVGAVYLENNLTARVFTSDRIAVLELLASQAAISLENARLYADLQKENAERERAEKELRRSEAFLAEGQRISHTSSWEWNIATGKLAWSKEHYMIFGFDSRVVEPTISLLLERIHPEDRAFVQQSFDAAIRERRGFALDFRIAFPDGTVKFLHGVGHPVVQAGGNVNDYIGTTMDITERKRGEDALRAAQSDLTRVARLTTMGELAASIAHEVNQPLGAIVTNSDACLLWLAKDNPPLDEVRQAIERIARDGHRAGDIIRSVRALARKSGPEMTPFDINDAIREVLVLIGSELHRHDVVLEMELSGNPGCILGDRVQLQQVILNLLMNGIEAMSTAAPPRGLRVSTQEDGEGGVRIAVEDSGPGFAPETMEHLFDAFFTTKQSGLGMGLSICRSIVGAHGGRLWAEPRSPRGAIFQFTLPAGRKKS
jgi:PAS domain S-box-containing protein